MDERDVLHAISPRTLNSFCGLTERFNGTTRLDSVNCPACTEVITGAKNVLRRAADIREARAIIKEARK